jgi:dipeptidyl aminopeptidase/acylaminoacyl peptidase
MALLPMLQTAEARLRRWDLVRLAAVAVAVAVAPLLVGRGPAAAETPQEQAPRGRIVFMHNTRMALIRSDGTDLQYLTGTDLPLEQLPNNPRLSPDGRRVAYGTRPFPQTQDPSEAYVIVHVRDLGQAAGSSLETKAHYYCWGPDGRKLVVGFFDQGAVKNSIVDVETTETSELKLPPNHIVVDWSPDGKSLLTVSLPEGDPPRPHVNLARSDGTLVRRLSAPEHGAALGRFSPDGRHVLYVTGGRPTYGHVFVTDLSGAKPVQVTNHPNCELMGACWSPDGNRIAYAWRERDPEAKFNQPTESHLMTVRADGSDVQTLMTETAANPGLLTLHAPDWR